MKRRARRIPVLDACKLVFAKRELGDLDAALALLGLARSASAKAMGVPDDTALIAAAEEAPAELEQEDEVDDAEEAPAELEQEDEVDDEDDFQRPSREPRKRDGQPGEAGASLDDRPHFRSYERAMVCYLLPPDQPSPDQQAERHVYEYRSIHDKVQRVEQGGRPPDAESWRAAKSVAEAGRVVSRRGKIDLRECANRIARAEVLEHLPRVRTPEQVDRVEVLVDAELTKGALSSDVDQFVRALRSVGPGAGRRFRRLVHRNGLWLAGAGPIWTFTQFSPAVPRTWYIVIAGGTAAAPAALEPWDALIGLISARHHVTVVWLGDAPGRDRGAWLSFRAEARHAARAR